MDAHELAAWMEREHEKVEKLLSMVQDKSLVVPDSNLDKWRQDLLGSFEHLRAHFQKHMALEEHDGYLRNVLERRPTLGEKVETLKREHTELAAIADGIYRDLQQVDAECRLLIRDCCRRIGHFVDDIQHHENAENVLVLAVFNRDIGDSH